MVVIVQKRFFLKGTLTRAVHTDHINAAAFSSCKLKLNLQGTTELY